VQVADLVPAFLAVCPRIAPSWQQYLDSWRGESQRAHYNDACVVAHHLVDRFEHSDLSEFPAAFALLERCLVQGDGQTKELAAIGIIEDIQKFVLQRTRTAAPRSGNIGLALRAGPLGSVVRPREGAPMGGLIRLELTGDEALVLFEFLQRFDDEGTLAVQDQAEERALWNLHILLQKQLVEIFQPEYKALVAAARDRLRDPTD
jgi:hypothetical protein